MLKRFYNFSIANPSPFEWLDSLVEIYTDDNKHKLYLDELERLSKIYIKVAYHTLLEAENNFLNCIEAEKHLDVIKLEKFKCEKMIEGNVINFEEIINYTSEKLPTITKN